MIVLMLPRYMMRDRSSRALSTYSSRRAAPHFTAVLRVLAPRQSTSATEGAPLGAHSYCRRRHAHQKNFAAVHAGNFCRGGHRMVLLQLLFQAFCTSMQKPNNLFPSSVGRRKNAGRRIMDGRRSNFVCSAWHIAGHAVDVLSLRDAPIDIKIYLFCTHKCARRFV